MNPNDWRIYVLAAILAAVYLAVRHWLRLRTKAKSHPASLPAGPCLHFWRIIAAPYCKQCRKCGVVEYANDAKGDFPDGLMEYMEAMRHYRPPGITNPYLANPNPPAKDPPPGHCHCGATMEIVQDEDYGEVWYCEICGSWRKTPKQDALDTASLAEDKPSVTVKSETHYPQEKTEHDR